ncbi:hypothetical protein OMP40_32010 [Cohnella rhizosphaerae]|uniref:Uncharacterized protein n=1 Tax=Cohnella rhizosphaerae TaxID=1457232 RepID=A0A9X4KZ13_9BACL|nr:hypothetical protein [Cohnella rhizosphaerae]MDG0813393.1 hypothetical protein [Cohnella rhizosphaerae]
MAQHEPNAVLAASVHHLPAIAQRQGGGLLAEDVLALRGCRDNGRLVQMIRAGHDNGIHVRAAEKRVRARLRIAPELAGNAAEIAIPAAADGCQAYAVHRGENARERRAEIPAADDPDADAFHQTILFVRRPSFSISTVTMSPDCR